MTPREKTIALLAQAGAELEVKLSAHNVERAIFDALPGDEKTYSSSDSGRVFFSKRGRIGTLEWAAFTDEPPL
jgi:hypothetical protein